MTKIKLIIIAASMFCMFPASRMVFSQTQWVGTWVSGQQLTESSNLPPSPGLSNNTLRQVVHAAIGGSQIRVLFSNQYGNATLTMNSVHIAVSSGSSGINTGTDKALAFNGSASVAIPAGQTVWSDTVSFNLAALSNLAVSVYFGSTPSDVTGHPGSRTTSYLQSGNVVTNASLSGSATDHWYILAGIDVATDGSYAAVVTLGDSITDGRGSTTNGNDRWPDDLAKRLQADSSTNKIAVLNQGIGGNAVVSGGLGPTALSRFDRDVVNQSGVKWCIVLEGVNDIGGSQSATNLISAYNEFIDKAHAKNIRIYGVPILPFGGSSYDSTDHQTTRATVNDWIRTSGRFDAVIDLDVAVRDSSNPNNLASAYDSGDHLHLNPAGYQKMADSILLSLFSSGTETPAPTTPPADTLAQTTTPTDAPIGTASPTETPVPTSVPTATPYGVTANPTSPIIPTLDPTIPPADTVAPTTPPSETTPPGSCTCTNLCTATIAITTPFTYNGSGEYCWTATSLATYINSWNTDSVIINNIICTNTYVQSSTITAINGTYYIYYKGSYSWSHIEIK